MTASEYIKAQGLPSLAYVAKAVGRHPDTIHNWYRDNFPLFEAVVAGVIAKGAEHEKCCEDLTAYGMSFMRDGKRIDPRNVYIDEEKIE